MQRTPFGYFAASPQETPRHAAIKAKRLTMKKKPMANKNLSSTPIKVCQNSHGNIK
jgi:hypothetical protein